ncbi:hypothetical protein HK100_012450 [Physocladia obscura]|uniref:Uncharacterized protein n=1 Tax=Physocladia obscura TaxID=109957 RepID=A0AAD5T2C2_9FUNG|nr:hypothetical protein HK100_012450 [Physocladia obscura]
MAAATNTEWLQIYQINNIGNKTSNYAGFREILTANSAFFRPANLVINFTTDGTVNVADYISQCIAEFSDKPSILQVGTALLGSFVQYAWTGPNLNFDLDSFLPSQVQSKTIPNISIIRKLSSDGEEVYALTPNLLHFYLARLILVDNASSFSSSATAPWWKMRALFIHQRILDAPAASINDSILSAALEVEEVLKNNLGEEDPRIIGELNARFRLELGLVHHYYGRQAKGLDEFSKAQEATKLEWNITGALGKRTKFQTFDVTQLVLIAESKISGNRHDTDVGKAQNHPTLPETLALNDDTLLETIDYTDLKSKGGNLAVIDQCILLAMCINVKNSNPSDGLTTEQMKPFVSRILENPNNWMVHTMALLMRSRLEASKSRTAERSVLQLQALVDQMAAEHDSTPSERLNYIYSLGIPSKWELEVCVNLVSVPAFQKKIILWHLDETTGWAAVSKLPN